LDERREMMKKALFIGLAVILTLTLTMIAFAAARGKMDLKAGDEIYACNCGESCDCKTMSRNPGNCTCGKEMVKAKVASIESGKVMLQAAGWEKPRAFKTSGAYACNCPPSCKCDTISQKPGKCTCGVTMKDCP
jgi:hypothetical protein